MAKPRLLRTEAIVLKRSDFGEADRLLTLYTPLLGKFNAIAKGARRPASRLGGHVEIFTHCQLLLAKGRNLDIVTQGETLHSFMHLRDDLQRAGYACYIGEILDRLTVDRLENQPLYRLLLNTLDRLDRTLNPRMAVHLFEMQVLDHLGYRPQLHSCLQCAAPLAQVVNFLSPAIGGALCPLCGQKLSASREVTVPAMKILRLLQTNDFGTAARVRLDDDLEGELGAIMRGQIHYVLEGELRSVAVLKSMRVAGR